MDDMDSTDVIRFETAPQQMHVQLDNTEEMHSHILFNEGASLYESAFQDEQ